MARSRDRALRHVALLLFALVFTRSAFAIEDPASFDCDHHYFSEGKLCPLPEDVQDFYGPLAAAAHVPVSDLLGSLAADRQSRHFRFSELVSLLRSLREIVKERTAEVVIQPDELTWVKRPDDVIVAWVNPVCSSCQAAIAKYDELTRADRNGAPAIIFRLQPSHDAISAYATATLELIRIIDSDMYVSAVRSFLDLLPDSQAGVLKQFHLLMDTEKDPEAYPEFVSAQALADRAARIYPGDLGTPLFVYQGRVIRLNQSGGRVFDPFRHVDDLAITIKMIRLEEVANASSPKVDPHDPHATVHRTPD